MPITYSDLDNAYPSDRQPCRNANGSASFDNQCAIRMSVCLIDASVDLSSCRATRCWFGHGRNHVLRAQELATWLASRSGRLAIGATEARRTNVTHRDYAGRSGIVFFRNFWGAGNQGDHIDLWDGEAVRTGAADYFTRSQQIWFWEIA